MSPFPDGMTARDWRHIEGEPAHYEECPWHEDRPYATAGPREVCICDDLDRNAQDTEAERRWQERRDEGETL